MAAADEGSSMERVRQPDDIVYDWDLVTDRISWGPNAASVLGIDAERLSTGIGYAEHLATASPSSRYEAVTASGGCDTGGGVPFTAIYGLSNAKRSNTPPIWVEDSGRWFADARDRPNRAQGVVRVITARYEAERLLAAADVDAATGTFSRARFIDHVTRKLNAVALRSSSFAVMLIGLEPADPDTIVDGDAVAAALAHLRADMRAHESVARHDASRFFALLEDCNADQAAAAAQRFIARVAEPLPGVPAMQARIGAVLAPHHGRTPQALLQFAEDALGAACRPTSPAYVRYDPDSTRPTAAGPRASDDILAAINEGRVALALQPVVDGRTRQPAFHEAFVRIRRTDGTLMLPGALVPIAEKDGLLALLDRRVLDLAFSALARTRSLKLSINVSMASMHDTLWQDYLRAACKLRPDAARRLTIEIAETSAVADIEAARIVLAAIKPLGVRIAIDAFGSGCCSGSSAGATSYRMLRDLPIDYLKIDGVFSRNLATSPEDRSLVRTLIELARSLKVPAVVGWIEDEATASIVAGWGVEYLQGYLFGRAEMDADARPAAPTATADPAEVDPVRRVRIGSSA